MNRRTKRTILLGLGLSPFIGSISTAMAVKGLATAPALYFEMMGRAGEWRTYVEHQRTGGASAQSVADALAPVHRSLCSAADSEISRGGISGSAGTGAVSAALTSSCEGLGAIDETLRTAAARDAKRSERIEAGLERLRKIPEEEERSVFERQRLFRNVVGEIKADLAKESAENLREKVGAQVAILAKSVISLDGQGGKFGARQESAVSNLKTQLAEVEKTVNGFLAQSAGDDKMAEPSELSFSGSAILHWWKRLIPQIMLAVATDLAIIWIAAFLAVSRASLRDAEIALRRKDRIRTTRTSPKTRAKI